jgi:hypothetical protein
MVAAGKSNGHHRGNTDLGTGDTMAVENSLIDDADREKITTEMNRLDFKGDAVLAVQHFAFLVPQGKRFTSEDVEACFLAMDFHVDHVVGVCSQAKTRGIIHWDRAFVQKTASSAYYMGRDVRMEYAQKLRANQAQPEPELRGVSQDLQNRAASMPQGDERVFLDETILCLKIAAYRAAIVMGWNLAYDHLRRFVIAHKLSDFNTVLTTKNRPKTQVKYAPAVTADDFPEKESFVLQIYHQAGIVTKNQMDILEPALKDRNLYAHPSSVQASAPIAAGHIDKLVRNIVTDPGFKI